MPRIIKGTYPELEERRFESKYLDESVPCFCWTCLARFPSKRQLFDHLHDKRSHMVDYANIVCCGNSFNVANKSGVSLLGLHLAYTKPCHTPADNYNDIVCCGIPFGDNYDRYVFHLCNDRPRHSCRRSAVNNALSQAENKMMKYPKQEEHEFEIMSPQQDLDDDDGDDGDDDNDKLTDHALALRTLTIICQTANNSNKDVKTSFNFRDLHLELESCVPFPSCSPANVDSQPQDNLTAVDCHHMDNLSDVDCHTQDDLSDLQQQDSSDEEAFSGDDSDDDEIEDNDSSATEDGDSGSSATEDGDDDSSSEKDDYDSSSEDDDSGSSTDEEGGNDYDSSSEGADTNNSSEQDEEAPLDDEQRQSPLQEQE